MIEGTGGMTLGRGKVASRVDDASNMAPVASTRRRSGEELRGQVVVGKHQTERRRGGMALVIGAGRVKEKRKEKQKEERERLAGGPGVRKRERKGKEKEKRKERKKEGFWLGRRGAQINDWGGSSEV